MAHTAHAPQEQPRTFHAPGEVRPYTETHLSFALPTAESFDGSCTGLQAAQHNLQDSRCLQRLCSPRPRSQSCPHMHSCSPGRSTGWRAPGSQAEPHVAVHRRQAGHVLVFRGAGLPCSRRPTLVTPSGLKSAEAAAHFNRVSRCATQAARSSACVTPAPRGRRRGGGWSRRRSSRWARPRTWRCCWPGRAAARWTRSARRCAPAPRSRACAPLSPTLHLCIRACTLRHLSSTARQPWRLQWARD